jgi:hypothetical protein
MQTQPMRLRDTKDLRKFNDFRQKAQISFDCEMFHKLKSGSQTKKRDKYDFASSAQSSPGARLADNGQLRCHQLSQIAM